ncbi:diacylglycerol kinase family protein [Nocardioides sp. NPDC004968]|uniref:diacylglycerol/lipid kinase family protein n=1 Tax=Nocardioides sp. NPDC004968 TaxID=3155894 RepID=UPI0033B155AB
MLAATALVLGAATIVLAVVVAVGEFPRGVGLLGCVLVAGVSAWYGILRSRAPRVVGLAVAVLAIALALGIIVVGGAPLVDLLVVAGLLVTLAAARGALAVHVDLPGAPAPRHPVLFFNLRSGGGKAERFELAMEARARGIEPIELGAGDDLEVLVRDAVARGADGLAMAGGDGSQAIVAAVAAEFGLPYACVPAGTRNHFALDLGVDRDDVVGALEAFVDAGERRVDVGDVNGRVFVNNVSLGLYAEAVQREGYRDAKIRTLLDTVPEALGPGGDEVAMRWRGPGGHEHRGGAAVLVSNNRYRLGRAIGSGTRPRIDDGLLGITVVGAVSWRDDEGRALQRPWREWSAPTFRVDAERPVAAGIDGEALVLEPPLHFRIRPGVLRVRVARKHPGASPSATLPDGIWAGVVELARIALGRDQRSATSTQGDQHGPDGSHGTGQAAS